MQWFKWIYDSKIRLFSFFWLLLFVLYLPTWRAGFVSDFTGWLYDIRYSSFTDHINRSHFQVKSLYQFTQLVTWFLYQIMGTNHFLWHCMHISLHALNVTLLYTLITALFTNEQNIGNRPAIFIAMLFFCFSPTLSEVIVWEASFHYLLGFLLFLSILRLVQLYQQNPSNKILWAIAALYFLSTFSIELFYITPLCVAALILFYNKNSALGGIKWPKKWVLIVAPQMLLLILHFVLVKINYGVWLPHISTGAITEIPNNILLSKPLKLIFHLLFFGRFYGQDFRDKVYWFCESYVVIGAFYVLVLATMVSIFKFSKADQSEKSALVLLFFWLSLCLALSIPLWFPQSFWVVYDRYAYFSMGLLFIACTLLCHRMLARWINIAFFILFSSANIFASYKVNKKWQVSAQLSHELISSLPIQEHKKIILLNIPQAMNGIFMITANQQNEAFIMRSLLYQPLPKNEIIEVFSYNINAITDGAHVRVLSDSTIHVSLNQWGTWWWYNDIGAVNYQNKHFKVNIDAWGGYDLMLKGNPNEYILLYQVGRQWKRVIWDYKGKEQY